MAFDFKKVQKEYYSAKDTPTFVAVPPMQFAAISGQGDPNRPNGAYQQALSALYAVAYTLRMSYKGAHRIEGFFEYVVPPLEGFWQRDAVSLEDKEKFCWTALLRLPDFISPEDLAWAKETAAVKKKVNCSGIFFLQYEEGLCVQIMHHGSYDEEPVSIEKMSAFLQKNGHAFDLSEARPHHEIYLSDPRKTPSAQCRTVLRLPIRPL